MRFGAIATNLAERLALAAGRVPLPLLDSLYGIVKARALMAGVRLGVFEALRDERRSAAELAPQLRCDAGALDALLRVLVYSEYLVQDGDRYGLSKLGRRSLLHGGAMDLHGFVLWNYTQWDMVAGLEDVVRTGRGLDFHATLADPEVWGHYQRGMFEIARLDAPTVAARVRPPRGATRLLDLAGSHGLFGAALCRKHPPLRATVFDLPQALPAARELAREAGIDDVVEHRAGDLRNDDLGTEWDVILMCNILHHFEPEAIGALLRRVRAALRRGGVVAIWEVERPRHGSKVSDGDGAALYFRLTSTGGAYHGDEYAAWLRDAGLGTTRVQRPLLSPGNVLVTARSE